METSKIKWLDICYILKHSSFGRELDPKDGRPAIILSDPKYIVQYGVAQVIYLTRGDHCDRGELHPIIKGYGLRVSDSIARTEQITTVDSTLIGDFIAEIPSDFIPILIRAVCKSINLESYLSSSNGEESAFALRNQINDLKARTCEYQKRIEDITSELKASEEELTSYKTGYEDVQKRLERSKKLITMYRNLAEEATLRE